MVTPNRDIVRSQFWVGELLVHHDVLKLFARLRTDARLKRLEYELMGAAQIPYKDFSHQNRLKRYESGKRSCRDGDDSLIARADAKFPGSAKPFRSPLWIALGKDVPDRRNIDRQALGATWAQYWEIASCDVDMLVHFDDVDALGCLLLHVALAPENSNLPVVLSHSSLVWLWINRNWPSDRLATSHVRNLIDLIRSQFFGWLILPESLAVPPPSPVVFLEWLYPVSRPPSPLKAW